MNAKLSHCISRTLFLLPVLMLAFHQETAAQEKYEKTLGVNLWNYGRNANGLRLDEYHDNASFAQIQAGIENGGFHASNQADESLQAGAKALTVTWSPRISMVGSFSFDQIRGKDMCGSMFIRPGQYPFDVLEFTPGIKILQEYSFEGGIAADMGEHWKIGGRMDFESDNYAKRKDLRHTNYALDLELVPSIMYTYGSFSAGLSYIFRKTSESIQAEEIGTSAETYDAFLDKGLMYGAYQAWDGSGIHLAEAGVDRFPVHEYTNGIAAQVQLGEFYGEAEFDITSGTVGEKDYTWFTFPGRKFSATAGYRIKGENALHVIRFLYGWSLQQNDEYVIDKTTTGGVTTPQTYGCNRIFERRSLSFGPRYKLFSDKLYMDAGLGITSNKRQSTLCFPYSHDESFTMLDADISVSLTAGKWILGMELSYADEIIGQGPVIVDPVLDPDNGWSRPYRLSDWYRLNHEWETCGKIGAGAFVKRYFRIGKADNLFVRADVSLLKGMDLQYINGSTRTGTFLKIGYDF